MIEERTPDWLDDFQRRFSAVLRTPLDRSSGTLRANPERYDQALRQETLPRPTLSAAERLAIYNRQYWLRLFGLMQSAFPLTSRLCGYWAFNELAVQFLTEHAPRGWNIDRVPDGFENFVVLTSAATGPHVGARGTAAPELAILEAAKIDAAWRAVFLAPAVPAYRLSPADAEHLLAGRLRPSPTAVLVEEHWPLLELRRDLVDDAGEARVTLPPRLEGHRAWALVRRRAGVGQLLLEPREAQLFALLREHSVGEALARLEATCSQEERGELPVQAQGWLARSVELDFWCGFDP